jgi:hypothetical protein
MQNVQTAALKKQLANVSYSTSSHTHWFYVNGIYLNEVETLREYLQSCNLYNGDINLNMFGANVIHICYETTDTCEYSDDFAYELADTLNENIFAYMQAIR